MSFPSADRDLTRHSYYAATVQRQLPEAREVGGDAWGRNGGQVVDGLACDPSSAERRVGVGEARRAGGRRPEVIR